MRRPKFNVFVVVGESEHALLVRLLAASGCAVRDVVGELIEDGVSSWSGQGSDLCCSWSASRPLRDVERYCEMMDAQCWVLICDGARLRGDISALSEVRKVDTGRLTEERYAENVLCDLGLAADRLYETILG